MTQSIPDITEPAPASHRLEPCTRAALDAMKAVGAEVRIAHFAKVQMPDCQPGWTQPIKAMTAQGTRERTKPAVPRWLSDFMKETVTED